MLAQQTRGEIGPDSRSVFQNDWDLWVYPPKADTAVPAGITVADDWNDAVLARLRGGGKVLLMIPPGRVRNDGPQKPVRLGFSRFGILPGYTVCLPLPWHPLRSAASGPGRLPHRLPQQLAVVVRGEPVPWPMILDDMPAGLRPIVQVVDDWFICGKLGLVSRPSWAAASWSCAA